MSLAVIALSTYDPALSNTGAGFDRNISAVIAFFSTTMFGQILNPPDKLTPM
jgi:hypothetical protein